MRKADGKAGKIQPVPNATTPAIVEYAAATNFVIDVATAAGGACTATVELFGKLADA